MPEYRKLGDSLRGDKIVASARRVGTMRVAHRTSKHKGTIVDLRDNAYCVIEVPLKSILNKKP